MFFPGFTVFREHKTLLQKKLQLMCCPVYSKYFFAFRSLGLNRVIGKQFSRQCASIICPPLNTGIRFQLHFDKINRKTGVIKYSQEKLLGMHCQPVARISIGMPNYYLHSEIFLDYLHSQTPISIHHHCLSCIYRFSSIRSIS